MNNAVIIHLENVNLLYFTKHRFFALVISINKIYYLRDISLFQEKLQYQIIN